MKAVLGMGQLARIPLSLIENVEVVRGGGTGYGRSRAGA